MHLVGKYIGSNKEAHLVAQVLLIADAMLTEDGFYMAAENERNVYLQLEPVTPDGLILTEDGLYFITTEDSLFYIQQEILLEGSILTEDGSYYLTTEDELNYIQQETI